MQLSLVFCAGGDEKSLLIFGIFPYKQQQPVSRIVDGGERADGSQRNQFKHTKGRMEALSHNELEVIVGGCFRCRHPAETADAREVIRSNPKAESCYRLVRNIISVLDHLTCGPCPEGLVRATIARLKLAAGIMNIQ